MQLLISRLILINLLLDIWGKIGICIPNIVFLLMSSSAAAFFPRGFWQADFYDKSAVTFQRLKFTHDRSYVRDILSPGRWNFKIWS